MSSDAVTYDEVLPERATALCGCGCGTVPSQIIPPECDSPARAGDTIEVPCDECGGQCYWHPPLDPEDERPCPRCSGAGTLRVRLTEDPALSFEYYDQRARCVGWRHVGTVVTDGP